MQMHAECRVQGGAGSEECRVQDGHGAVYKLWRAGCGWCVGCAGCMGEGIRVCGWVGCRVQIMQDGRVCRV